MGSPNNGPFHYMTGSTQNYTTQLDEIAKSSPITTTRSYNTRNEFIDSINNLDGTIQPQAKSFAKRTGSAYQNFNYTEHENGLRVLKATKPGNVPGSRAEYIKVLFKDGTIRAVYKDTYDNKGNYVGRHVKWPKEEK